eukprot:COSAG06_NODE_51164_length_314_cov_0.511628_1_plen_84_part_10
MKLAVPAPSVCTVSASVNVGVHHEAQRSAGEAGQGGAGQGGPGRGGAVAWRLRCLVWRLRLFYNGGGPGGGGGGEKGGGGGGGG